MITIYDKILNLMDRVLEILMDRVLAMAHLDPLYM